MREPLKDKGRLQHILTAIEKLLNPLNIQKIEKIEEEDLEYFGMVKLLEIIGEASYMLTVEFKENHPETPWRTIIKMRHVLVHGYYTISKENVIKTIMSDLPILKEQILSYLNE